MGIHTFQIKPRNFLVSNSLQIIVHTCSTNNPNNSTILFTPHKTQPQQITFRPTHTKPYPLKQKPDGLKRKK
jgi:hypothetical protein